MSSVTINPPTPTPTPLQSGLYSIQSVANGGWVSINQIQNTSATQEPVVVVNPGVRSPSWNVTQTSSGAYELSLNGATTAPLANEVFAFTDGSAGHNEAWELNAFFSGSEWHYTIKSTGGNAQTWFIGPNFGDQISLVPVRPVPQTSDVLPEIPPQELFRFGSLD
ncbi:Peptidase inhibitor I66 [Abortiporus biennis]